MDLVGSLGLLFLLFLRARLHILYRQLVEVLLAPHGFEDLHATLKQATRGDKDWA